MAAAITKSHKLFLLFCALSVVVAQAIQGSRTRAELSHSQRLLYLTSASEKEFIVFKGGEKRWRRKMIGSVAPTCTYNECRGCKYRCRAEQVPVEGNDPIHSPYHYKCICHR